jgi:hypothetical protein
MNHYCKIGATLTVMLALVGLAAAQPASSPPASAADSRGRILRLNADDIGLTRSVYPHEIWGVMMDTTFPGGMVVSLVVAGDGTSDMIWSTGRKIMGAGEYERVKHKSHAFLQLVNATPAVSSSPSVAQYPYPKEDEICFYFLTRNGVKAHCEGFVALSQNRSDFSRIFESAHEVITGIRTVFEERVNNK